MPELRHARQAKLREVGPEGQARIAATVAHVTACGFAGEVAARYLAGSGVRELVVASAEQAEAARSVDRRVRARVQSLLPAPSVLGFEGLDPAAREVAVGAHLALMVLRRAILGGA